MSRPEAVRDALLGRHPPTEDDERVGPETTVVVAGPESFVTSVEASGGNESVTVTASDD